MPEIIVKLGDNIVQKNFFVNEDMHIGRAPDNEIVIENLAISRSHAVIHCQNGKYILNDMGSSNGSYVNGVRVKKTQIVDRDVISIGKYKLYFYDQNNIQRDQANALADVDRTMLVEASAQPTLEIVKGKQKGQCFDLNSYQTTIGRGSDNDIRLQDWFVSKQHARIEQRDGEYFIVDLDSWRHTYLNGRMVEEAMIHEGDEIQLGPTVAIKFKIEELITESSNNARVPVELEPEGAGDLPDPEQPASRSEEDEAEEEAPEAQLEGLVENMADASVQAAAEALDQQAEDAGRGADTSQGAINVPSFEDPTAEEGPEQPGETGPAEEDASEGNRSGGEAPPPATQPEPAPDTPPVDPAHHGSPAAPSDPQEKDLSQAAQEQHNEIAIWERALRNKSPLIRKQAARRLKQLTGRDYDH